MYAVIVGVLLVAAKLAELGPFADWSWWIVLAPFALALAWWFYADSTGLTKKREIRRMEERKVERRRKAAEALGLTMSSGEREEALRRARAVVTNPIERQRAEKRTQNKKQILDSVLNSSQIASFEDSSQPRKDPKA
jgi:small Trp-rich protein